MNKRRIIFFLIFGLSCLVYGQDTNITNNNTITIQGNVYYFKPSTTPSSPPPTQSSDFLGSGSWYGEDAAKAWASIADWVIDRHVDSSSPVRSGKNDRIYISAVHVIRNTDKDFTTLKWPWGNNPDGNGQLTKSTKQVRIDYWVVKSGAQMSEGKRETRWFGF